MGTARPKPGQLEQRDAPLEADGKKIRGRIPFGTESRDMGGWREVIEPGALDRATLDDLVATVDHVGVPIGRYPNTLELEARSDGLHWAVDPPRSRADILEAVERGDLRGGSWRMRVGQDEWRGDVRHVLEIIELRDVAIVTTGAYPPEAAAVEFRSKDNNAAEERQEEKDTMEEQEQRVEETREEGRPPAGSLRVEERAESALAHSLSDLFAGRGFFEDRSASVTWDEYRSFTWSAGTVLTDLNPVRRDGVPLGYDTRWLYPVMPTTAVDAATTSVQYLRQTGRALAGTAVIRPIDATSQKPETSGTAELASLQLSQVASVQSGIPRIHASQPLFQSLVEQDLRLAINDGLDEIVRRGVSTAGTAATVVGDVVAKIRRAKSVVEAAGYQPSVLAIDPAGAEQLDLLVTGISGGTSDYVFSPGQPAPPVWGLQRRVWKSPGTAILDAAAFGRLYIAPVELRSFEADGGLTNKQNVRMETNAGYAVERLTAGLRII